MNEKKVELKVWKIILIIAVIAIIIIAGVLIAKNANSNNEEENVKPVIGKTYEGRALENSTYEGAIVKNIEITYLEDNNETMITMIIQNTKEGKIENENLDVILLNEAKEQLATRRTYIELIEAGQEYAVSVIFDGNHKDTQSIELKKVQ